jgi:glycosyltransferase involved in cell wall biosynthesis
MGLDYVPIPEHRRRPSPPVIRLLNRLVTERSIDVVHGYEWPPAVEAFLGPHLRHGTPVVATVLSASVVPFFPRQVPLLVGTEQLQYAARDAGHRRVMLMEPPVDTDRDRPGIRGREFRVEYAIDPDLPVVAMVCRLVPDLKRESLLFACAAVDEMAAAGRPVQLIIVGDGPIRAELAQAAAGVNERAGRRLVIMTGQLTDPRPAYDAADVVLGMGGSALRAMAFAKPLIVVGERGYSELLTVETAPTFLRDGWYGLGPGSLGAGATGLRAALELLRDKPAWCADLGEFGRELVLSRFSLRAAAETQEEEYRLAIAAGRAGAPLAADAARCAAGVVRYQVRRKINRWRGTAATDDANAQPLRAANRAAEAEQVARS